MRQHHAAAIEITRMLRECARGTQQPIKQRPPDWFTKRWSSAYKSRDELMKSARPRCS
jgi:hypothetical protein